MTSRAKPIPNAYRNATPYLCVRGAARAIEFYKHAFGAKEVMRVAGPDSKIAHAELRIGDAAVMLSDESPESRFRSPQALGGSPVTIQLYVEDVDQVARQVVADGARLLKPVEDQFYGDRAGAVEDPFGHVWWIATHKQDLSRDEVQKRAAAHYGKA